MEPEFDVAIIGGGLAGLALSIQLSLAGRSVILFEKEEYPFHRVCGEYISMESWHFLSRLGLKMDELKLPIITQLQLTSGKSRPMQITLPLGGFGISRFRLDALLAGIAKETGVMICENKKVTDVEFISDRFLLSASGRQWSSRVACGSFGKRSNIDVQWKRPFLDKTRSKLGNHIGVKYHGVANIDSNTIGLHLFANGYCGVVAIEGNKHNICYLTTAANLQASGNSIPQMEQDILSRNDTLKELLQSTATTRTQPITISQVSFDQKSQVEDHVILLGDAAGMITPLCGNGMSMALHGSKLATSSIEKYLSGQSSRDEMEQRYASAWKQTFGRRLRYGRIIQNLFQHPLLVRMMLALGRRMPFLMKWLIKQTHGKAF